jgi:hypothetical protein
MDRGVALDDVDDDRGLGHCRGGAYVGELKNPEHTPYRKSY